MQLTAEQGHPEVSQDEHLAQIGNVDRQTARRILRKHKGDMEKAVDALLAGDRGETTVWESQHRTTPEPRYSDSRTAAVASHPSSSVIDLTGDTEEELSRAIQLSMQDDTSGPHFRPTDRAPHPDWQMVRSNVMSCPLCWMCSLKCLQVPAPGASSSTQDRVLDDAIQASLQDFNKEDNEAVSLPPSVREGGRCVCMVYTSWIDLIYD